MKSLVVFILSIVMPVTAWAGQEDSDFLNKVANRYSQTLGFKQEYLGESIVCEQNVTYKKKTFEVSTTLQQTNKNLIEKAELSAAATLLQSIYGESSHEQLVAEVLQIEKHFPGFLETMVKAKSIFRVVSSIPGTNYLYKGELSSKELKQLIGMDTSLAVDIYARTTADWMNSTILPWEITDEMILNSVQADGKKLLYNIRVPHEALRAISQNKAVAKKLMSAVLGQKLSAINQNPRKAEFMEAVDLVYEYYAGTGQKQEVTLTAEERKKNAEAPADSVDVSMYYFWMRLMQEELPYKMNDYQYRIGYDYFDKTFVMIDSIATTNAQFIGVLKSPESVRGEMIGHIFNAEKLYSDFASKGVGVKRLFRFAGHGDTSCTMTAEELSRLLNSSQHVKDSLMIQVEMSLENLFMEQKECPKGYPCPKNVKMEGDNVIWSEVINGSLNDYKKSMRRGLYTSALEVFKEKNSVVRKAVLKLRKSLIYRIYSHDMKQHNDTTVPYEELIDLPIWPSQK